MTRAALSDLSINENQASCVYFAKLVNYTTGYLHPPTANCRSALALVAAPMPKEVQKLVRYIAWMRL